MITKIKRSCIGCFFIGGILLIIGGFLLSRGHFGPFGIKAGDDVLCSELKFKTGERFYVVAHRTGELIDAYHVFLYRIAQNGDVYKYTLGYEDSFWWGSALQLTKKDEIEIRAFHKPVAKYLSKEDMVVFLDGNYPPEGPQKATSDVIDRLKRTELSTPNPSEDDAKEN